MKHIGSSENPEKRKRFCKMTLRHYSSLSWYGLDLNVFESI